MRQGRSIARIALVRVRAQERVERGLRSGIDLLATIDGNEDAIEHAREILPGLRGLELDLAELAGEIAKLGES